MGKTNDDNAQQTLTKALKVGALALAASG